MSNLKRQEMQKFRKAQPAGQGFMFKLRRGVQRPPLAPDILYNEDSKLFEKDHPELYHEMKSRDLSLDDIRYVLTRKIHGFGRGELCAADMVENRYAINKMYEYLSNLEAEDE